MAYGQVNVDKTVNSDGTITGGLYGFKNRIINGAMMIDQRNGGALISSPGNGYTLDRWIDWDSVPTSFTVQQNSGSVTPPAGFTNYLGVVVTTARTPTSGQRWSITQAIEGYNVADLAYGTASAQTVTLSFWVRSSVTGNLGGAIKNGVFTRGYPFSYTINSANTWEQKTITIPGDTASALGATNGVGMYVVFNLGSGTNLSGTSGAWSAGDWYAPTGAVSIVSTLNATFYITGVQLEKGSTATSFDFRPYGTELALCQRYFQLFGKTGGSVCAGAFAARTGFLTISYGTIPLMQQMRSNSPSLSWAGTLVLTRFNGAGYSQQNVTVVSTDATGNQSCNVRIDTASAWTAGDQTVLSCDATGYVSFSAEL